MVSDRVGEMGNIAGLIEFGIPLGSRGRDQLGSLLASVTNLDDYVLWCNAHNAHCVSPLALVGRGVDLDRLVFAESQAPVQDLKHAIMSDVFRLVVLDMGDVRLRREEWVFLQHQSRQRRLKIWVIQSFFLSNRLGNPFAKVRVNMERGRATVVKGGALF